MMKLSLLFNQLFEQTKWPNAFAEFIQVTSLLQTPSEQDVPTFIRLAKFILTCTIDALKLTLSWVEEETESDFRDGEGDDDGNEGRTAQNSQKIFKK